MNCFTEEYLRTHADGELKAAAAATIQEHLQCCGKCRDSSAAITAQAGQVYQKLQLLAPEPAIQIIDTALAYTRYRRQYGPEHHERTAGKNYWAGLANRPVWGSLAVVCALVLVLSLAPGRSWAQKFLAMLRVQKLAVVPIDFSALGDGNTGSGKMLTQLISDNVVVTMNPGKPFITSSLDTAREMAGFKIRTMDSLGSPQQILISGEGAFHMTLNGDRMQAVLDQAGRSDIQIPASVDGSTVAVHTPKLVRLLYGDCSPQATPPGQHCIEFAQVPSPTVSVPPSLDIAALAEAGLQIAGMSAADAQRFCRTVDWSSTLVIPVPQNGGSYRTVPVDGVNGTLIESLPHGNFIGAYTLIWVKNGIVYALNGKGQSENTLSLIGSLH